MLENWSPHSRVCKVNFKVKIWWCCSKRWLRKVTVLPWPYPFYRICACVSCAFSHYGTPLLHKNEAAEPRTKASITRISSEVLNRLMWQVVPSIFNWKCDIAAIPCGNSWSSWGRDLYSSDASHSSAYKLTTLAFLLQIWLRIVYFSTLGQRCGSIARLLITFFSSHLCDLILVTHCLKLLTFSTFHWFYYLILAYNFIVVLSFSLFTFSSCSAMVCSSGLWGNIVSCSFF